MSKILNVPIVEEEGESSLPCDFIRRIMRRFYIAWDPSFTKVTFWEKKRLAKADVEMKNGEYITDEESIYN